MYEESVLPACSYRRCFVGCFLWYSVTVFFLLPFVFFFPAKAHFNVCFSGLKSNHLFFFPFTLSDLSQKCELMSCFSQWCQMNSWRLFWDWGFFKRVFFWSSSKLKIIATDTHTHFTRILAFISQTFYVVYEMQCYFLYGSKEKA